MTLRRARAEGDRVWQHAAVGGEQVLGVAAVVAEAEGADTISGSNRHLKVGFFEAAIFWAGKNPFVRR